MTFGDMTFGSLDCKPWGRASFALGGELTTGLILQLSLQSCSHVIRMHCGRILLCMICSQSSFVAKGFFKSFRVLSESAELCRFLKVRKVILKKCTHVVVMDLKYCQKNP